MISTEIKWLISIGALASTLGVHTATGDEKPAPPARPNFIIIFTDDQGYNDLGCFGSQKIKTPNIDRLASEGRRYTSCYVPSSVCSPSRAGLLTGCYPKRVGMQHHVLFPDSNYGLHPEEVTIADHLKSLGYVTACAGKWHVGHLPELLPRQQGFDSYFGIPYSNDMTYPDNKHQPKMSSDDLWRHPETAVTKRNTPLFRNEEIIELPVDQRTLTRRYTDEAIKFITANQDKPFFLYLPHSMPHIPLYVPADAYDPDPQHAYTCVIEHIDTEVGRLVKTVRDLGLADNTYIIYTSDNGPWLRFKNHGGSALPLRDGKGTTYEGGQRVPCIIWGPGRIPANTQTDAITSTMDLLPTIAALTDSKLSDRKIDGYDIRSTFNSDRSPRNELVYYSKNGELKGIRIGEWKFLQTLGSGEHAIGQHSGDELYHLKTDIGESKNLAKDQPEKVAQMMELDDEITRSARPVWRQASETKQN